MFAIAIIWGNVDFYLPYVHMCSMSCVCIHVFLCLYIL